MIKELRTTETWAKRRRGMGKENPKTSKRTQKGRD
jgi:hypothetical protein